MEKTNNIEKREVKFYNCDTVGDEIKALVACFTGRSLGEFILEDALKQVKENHKKIEEYKNKLLEGVN